MDPDLHRAQDFHFEEASGHVECCRPRDEGFGGDGDDQMLEELRYRRNEGKTSISIAVSDGLSGYGEDTALGTRCGLLRPCLVLSRFGAVCPALTWW